MSKEKDFYAQFNPKPKDKITCKKVKCIRYNDYVEWDCGNSALKFCMECKHAHVSQFRSSGNKLRSEG